MLTLDEDPAAPALTFSAGLVELAADGAGPPNGGASRRK
jgi:hypothetical protein